ncbi:MAG: 3-phosphoserine/phosphohydroxythreonine transaminase [Flavobacteriaceae bacterium]|jgi:phosphoserine aminotransferase|nr:3-phosphoserine/phosphohydroxythreonine transaminase [Flavobacteriaceae bacterium]MBT4112608.1 3-phosphoserine/phosphohydroxythreonine transaminase [Flavobacteriaceae bacterium]MBT4614462.1 3-phosphoserine/phosphohydroxythreonine transaminase [Flavobacteriaceae bacterium]MBT5246915.1 3-phosphoserine/phosphohydroxythreonine transaminase [Flavobacteriaceae bacterium]MBT5650099.1 3-phosphoserine/phosphohydroxythreonine transaminase [Flavobacteriaceae bacterium]
MKKHNFCAGPSILPKEVIIQAAESILDINESGLSLLEISHRSKAFVDIMEEARSLVLELTKLNRKDYSVLFLQGGASTQFSMVPYNILSKKAAYLDTGSWSSKAIKEAKLFGEITEIASSKDSNYNYIPKNYTISEDCDYFHCTSNNTIYGTQIKEFQSSIIPVVCDMSSDIFSRQLDFSKFDLIYAGAQKNLGPAGTTVVIIKNSVLGNTSRNIPSMMDYQTHINKSSLYNTPPVFSVYVSLLNMRWLKSSGGIKKLEEINNKKATILYSEIDINPFFKGHAKEEDRSAMNVTFNLVNDDFKETFDSMLKDAGIIGINGHISIGGYRASMYNAMPIESVKTLVEVMSELENKL